MHRRGMLAVAAAAALASPLPRSHAPAYQAPSPDTVVLANVALIDGTGTPPRAGTSILVVAGRVVDVYRADSRQSPAGAWVENLAGRFVIPGLIDAHAHVTGRGDQAAAAEQLRVALMGGLTTVRDMGGDAVVLGDLARAGADRQTPSPRVYYSAVFAGPGWFVDPRARASAHGGTPGELPWMRGVTPATDLPAAIAAAKATGATAIKIYADLTPDLVAAVAREAHRQGLRVWSHATIFPSRPRDAVAAGVDVLSHASLLVFEVSDTVPPRYHVSRGMAHYDAPVTSPALTALLTRMRESGTILDATLYVASVVRGQPAGGTGFADPSGLAVWTYAVTRRAHELGVAIAAGTDGMHGTDGPNLHREMELLVREAGLTPLEAIAAATSVAARAIGAQDSLGTVAPGKVADLVVLRSDPTADIGATRQIEIVMKGGVLYRP